MRGAPPGASGTPTPTARRKLREQKPGTRALPAPNSSTCLSSTRQRVRSIKKLWPERKAGRYLSISRAARRSPKAEAAYNFRADPLLRK